jgi:signal peptidase II
VVDFLLFDLGFAPANPWPAFNVADSCICVSVGLMLIASVREELDRRKAAQRG